jgi:hypothetical protein
MPWVRLADEFYDHPKFVRAGPAAGYLAIVARGYCNRHLTDGEISAEIVPRLGGSDEDAARLVAVGLWERNGHGGYRIHDFADYQPSRSDVRARTAELSAKRAEAGRAGARARWQANGKSDAIANPKAGSNTGDNADGNANAIANTKADGNTYADA